VISIKTQPAGIDGISILVKAHPELQVYLLDFLESIPKRNWGLGLSQVGMTSSKSPEMWFASITFFSDGRHRKRTPNYKQRRKVR
jgi:hypothetical protein